MSEIHRVEELMTNTMKRRTNWQKTTDLLMVNLENFIVWWICSCIT